MYVCACALGTFKWSPTSFCVFIFCLSSNLYLSHPFSNYGKDNFLTACWGEWKILHFHFVCFSIHFFPRFPLLLNSNIRFFPLVLLTSLSNEEIFSIPNLIPAEHTGVVLRMSISLRATLLFYDTAITGGFSFCFPIPLRWCRSILLFILRVFLCAFF